MWIDYKISIELVCNSNILYFFLSLSAIFVPVIFLWRTHNLSIWIIFIIFNYFKRF